MSKTKIKIEIKNVVASKQAHFFIVVQMKQPNSDKSIKYRTQTSALTNRPKYQKSEFTFLIDDNPYTIKFGLMMAKSQLDSDVTNAMVFGVCSLPFTKSRLLQQSGFVYETNLMFLERAKEVGKISIKISLYDKQYKLNQEGMIFDPLISRVLYNQQCTDQARLEANVKILEEKLAKLYLELCESKKQQQFFQKLYYDLQQDEKQLKTQIQNLERINSKIQHKLDTLENLQNLKIEIDMLSQSEEGKKVLVNRLEYFQDRIYRQIEENEKLTIEYKKIRPEIETNLKKAQAHAQKLKGKHLQEFEIENNQKILQAYEDVYYQFQINQETIKSLSKMSQKSELTARQAKLLLSQVNYQVKLAEIGVNKDKNAKQNKLLKQIQHQINEAQKKEQKLSQEQEMVYKIKLSALQREIEETRKKLNNFQENSKEYAKIPLKSSNYSNY